MATLGTRYTVRRGDTLWSLAERHLGDGRKWPVIFEYNKRDEVVAQTGTRIVDPDIILIGQTILIPDAATATAAGPGRGTGPAAGPGPESGTRATPAPPGPSEQLSPDRDGRRPAFDQIYLPAFRFSLPNVPIRMLLGMPPTHMAEIKLTGSITIRSQRTIDFLTFTKDGFEIGARNEATMALQRLIADSNLKFDPGKGEVTFENGITVHANTPYAARAKVTMGMSATTGLPVAKASVKTPPIKGQIDHFIYLTENFGIEMEITPLPRQPGIQPRPQPYPLPGPQPYPLPGPQPYPRNVRQPTRPSNWEVLVGSALLGAALAVVVVTIVEDFATLGGGIADDAACGTVAAGMAARGWAMVRYAPVVVQGVQTVSSWAARAAPHVQRALQAVQLAGSQTVSIMVPGAGPVPAGAYVR